MNSVSLFALLGTATATTLYIGSYSSNIVRISLNAAGEMMYIDETPSELNPSWLTLNPTGDFLFAVSEVEDYSNPEYPYSGGISSFAVGGDGSLNLLSTVASGGASPAHAVTDVTGHSLYISNYCSGTIGVVPVNPITGLLEPPTQVIDHNPSPVYECEGAHIHEVVLSGANQTSIEVMDLGLNIISHYTTTDLLIDTPPAGVISSLPPGSGPRHLVLHPAAPWAFVINELDSTVSSMPLHRRTGALGDVTSTVSSLRPAESATDMAGGELQLSSDGKFLYVSNRDNSEPNLHRSSIAVFSVNADTGSLLPVQFSSTLGDHPRHFDLFFDGSLLVVANMNSDNIVSFTVDQSTGLLTPPPDSNSSSRRVLETSKPTQLLQAHPPL